MFVKVTASGPRRHVQLVESYRDDAGRVKKRTVATLGRVDQLAGELDSVIAGNHISACGNGGITGVGARHLALQPGSTNSSIADSQP